jgi:hypothetical protein
MLPASTNAAVFVYIAKNDEVGVILENGKEDSLNTTCSKVRLPSGKV